MRYRLVTFLVFGAALIGVGLWDAKSRALGFNQQLNQGWLDFCIGNSRDIIANPAVTFVRIDEETRPLNAEGDSLTRLDYGAMLRIIDNQEPRVVAVHSTPVFDEKNQLNQGTLKPLRTAAIALPPMTLGAVVESGQPPQDPAEKVDFPAVPAENVKGDIANLPNITRTTERPDPQMLENGSPAFTQIALAPSGKQPNLWVNLVARQGEEVVPSFIVAALLNHLGKDNSALHLQFPPESSKPQILIGDDPANPIYRIPVDNAGRMKVYEDNGIGFDFSDGTDAKKVLSENEQFSLEEAVRIGRIPHVNTNDLAFTAADDPELIKNLLSFEKTERLRRALESMDQYLVVVGDDLKSDRFITLPLTGEELSRAGLATRAIATIQSKRYIERWPLWLVGVGIAVILALGVWLFTKSRVSVFILGGLALMFYLAASVMIFKSSLLFTPPMIPIGLFALIIVIGLILPPTEKTASETAAKDA